MESIKLKIGGEGGIKEPGLTSVVSLLVPHFADADELTDVTVEILNAVPGLTLGQKSTIVRMCKSSGQGSQPSSSSQRARDPELDRLWSQLAECKKENGFIKLPKGLRTIFPLIKTKLMVRDCYDTLLKIVEQRSGVQLLEELPLGDCEMKDMAATKEGISFEKGYVDRAMMIVGTPGIGKSFWVIYLLILLSKSDVCVVLDTVPNKEVRENKKYLLSREGCFSADSVNEFHKELQNTDTFYLSDSRVPSAVPAMTILVSSPAKKIIYQQEKIAEDFYMPVWAPEEIVKLRDECYPYRSESDVVELYYCWGGIVRWVLEHPNTAKFRRKLIKAAEQMDIEQLVKACRGDNDDRVTSRIVHIIPTDDLTDQVEIRLATPYVSNLVCQELQRRSVDQVAIFLESTRGNHACSAMRGQLFESYVMYRQSKGGQREYAVKPPRGFSDLAGVTLPSVSFSNAGLASFMKLGDIKPDPSDAHKIWWPLDKNFKSVDFIRQPNEVCQVTLNPNHDPLDLNRIMECFEAVEDYSKQDKGLIFSYIVASELFDDQVDIPGIEFPERSQPSRACKVGGLKGKYKAHVEKIQWRIMAVPFH